jgi:hypothetical protein
VLLAAAAAAVAAAAAGAAALAGIPEGPATLFEVPTADGGGLGGVAPAATAHATAPSMS